MENLTLNATKYTPDIKLNSDGVFSIVGKSYPENTFEFYKPVMEWLKKYFSLESSKEIVVNMEISYFNSSSSKLFFDLFDLFDENKDKFSITINWIYDGENESAMEAGEDFIADFEGLNINLVEK